MAMMLPLAVVARSMRYGSRNLTLGSVRAMLDFQCVVQPVRLYPMLGRKRTSPSPCPIESQLVAGDLLGVADEQSAVGNDRVVPGFPLQRPKTGKLPVPLGVRRDQDDVALLRHHE